MYLCMLIEDTHVDHNTVEDDVQNMNHVFSMMQTREDDQECYLEYV